MEEVKQITTIDEDGNEVNLILLEIVTVDDQDYALLMSEDDVDSEEPETVLMRLKTEGDEYIFEVIEDDDEFDLVSQAIIDDSAQDAEEAEETKE
ncbi:DUF1292 domain-containing protein [bacterium]|nr:DUF1292 domain-containing protein [bacterium]